MQKIYENACELIGNTPLVRLKKIEEHFSLHCKLYAKLEGVNPGGSVKDRAAYRILSGALERGEITKDTVVLETTGGNTGIGLCMVCASLSLKITIITPDDIQVEKVRLYKAYGANVVLTPAHLGLEGAQKKAQEISETLESVYTPSLFENELNVEAHRKTTALEILSVLPKVDYFVCGVGTGGTLTGCSEVLKMYCPECKVVAVEPVDSPVISGGFPGSHSLFGLGAGFIPKILNTYIIDEVIRAKTYEAYELCRLLASLEGYLCGASSGACLSAALLVAARPEAQNKSVVTILPDTGLYYLDSGIF